MTVLAEPAPAKINLALRVIGRRDDGYHELDSLVAFASTADELELTPGSGLSLSVEGPFAAALEGPNLVLAAAEAAAARVSGLRLGHFHLVKNLPVAAGIGGGSADAGAALRLILRLNPEHEAALDIVSLAKALSSDAPACLGSRCALMTGRGEVVRPLPPLPTVPIVLVNPRIPVHTTRVFETLESKPLSEPFAGEYEPMPAAFADVHALVDYLKERRNDLEPPALRLTPEIGDVMHALSEQEGTLLVRLSGSGPTCFGLFATRGDAVRGADALSAGERWWTAAGILS